MNDDMTEILIGKYLDSEITPAEQRLLEAELAQNPQARQLFEDFQALQRQTAQALSQQLNAPGHDAATILDRALKSYPATKTAREQTWARRIGALAATLLLALGLYLLVAQTPTTSIPETPEPLVAENGTAELSPSRETTALAQGQPPTIRQDDDEMLVDWYSYTDETGRRWLWEGYRDRGVETVGYHGDL